MVIASRHGLLTILKRIEFFRKNIQQYPTLFSIPSVLLRVSHPTKQKYIYNYYQMKKLTIFFAAISLILGTTGCLEDKCDAVRTYTYYTPILKSKEDIRIPIVIDEPQELINPGKIYYFQNYLFINEREEGIHIFDNSDPSNPVNLSFIQIPGNIDMAVQGTYLYADNHMDLITMDISNPAQPMYVSRTEDVFPVYYDDYEKVYIVGYDAKTEEVNVSCEDDQGDLVFFDGVPSFNALDAGSNESSGINQASNAGVGGSMARFTLSKGHLYTVDENDLRVFDLAIPSKPELSNQVPIGWGIETIYPYGDNLFIGSSNGMFIFDNQNPNEPTLLSELQHWAACDPVVVEGTTAYVTLRDGNECSGFVNQLDVIDIKDLTNPVLLKSYNMHNPMGLAVLDQTLYLCENTKGLKVFDVSNWREINNRLMQHLQGFQAYDVIALAQQNVALVVGSDGLYQFDISDSDKLTELSLIPVKR